MTSGIKAAFSALAAVLGEVGQQAIHLSEFDPVDQVTPAALLADQAGHHQPLEVKRQRGVWNAQSIPQRAGRSALRAGHHQGSEHLQSIGLRQCSKGFDNVFFFHISIVMEKYDKTNTAGCQDLLGGNVRIGSSLLDSGQAGP